MQPHEILSSQGNCATVETSVMYPEEGDERAEAIARSVCNGCVVIELCKETAGKREHGVWAGMTQHERYNLNAKIRRVRRGNSKHS